MTVAAAMFDTHAFVKRLVSTGFTERQAETLAQEQIKIIDEHLATKGDIKMLKGDIKILRQDIKALELRMTVKFGAMMVTMIAVLATLKLVI
jgi:hypothetical protein